MNIAEALYNYTAQTINIILLSDAYAAVPKYQQRDKEIYIIFCKSECTTLFPEGLSVKTKLNYKTSTVRRKHLGSFVKCTCFSAHGMFKENECFSHPNEDKHISLV